VLELARTAGNPFFISLASVELATRLERQEDFDEALQLVLDALHLYEGKWNPSGQCRAMLCLAQLSLRAGQPARAIQLLSAARQLNYHPELQHDIDEQIGITRPYLNAAEEAAAIETGKRLTWDQLMIEAEALATAPRTPLLEQAEPDHPLTARERDVLALLADGKSNRVIAETLYLSERTVESHVTHILNKLDLDSRTAAAAFAIRSGLLPGS
jgi:DNA-binding CsgD family transcriptional regulator